MVVNDEYTADRDRRTGRAKGWKGPERRHISPDAEGQLLEQGDQPAGPAGSFAGSSTEFTTGGGEGSNEPNEFTAQRNRTDVGALGTDDREGREPDEADPRRGGTGDEGGAATLGGGVFEGQGDADDAPRYGDWVKHSTGTTSGARGQEGEDFPGENTWGEEEAERERRISGADRRKNRPHED